MTLKQFREITEHYDENREIICTKSNESYSVRYVNDDLIIHNTHNFVDIVPDYVDSNYDLNLFKRRPQWAIVLS